MIYYVLFGLITFIIITISLILYVFVFSNKKDIEDPLIANSEKEYIAPNVSSTLVTDKKAIVLCSCNKTFSVERNELNLQHTCFMINSDNGTGTDCKFSCIGLGDCVKACPQQAIEIKNHTAVITNLCNGCGKCLDVCPIHIIQLVPKDTEKLVVCANKFKDPTSCSNLEKEEKVEWNNKKDFKIWNYCYKIFKNVIKNN